MTELESVATDGDALDETPWYAGMTQKHFDLAISRAVAAERERCTKLCRSIGELAADMYGDGAECIQTAEMCVEAINSVTPRK